MNMNITKKCRYEHQYDISMYNLTFYFFDNNSLYNDKHQSSNRNKDKYLIKRTTFYLNGKPKSCILQTFYY